jgi:3-deoxy-D-manno-octulosonate 8-phosphate phosphatase (KDO 8-P phosphatase)
MQFPMSLPELLHKSRKTNLPFPHGSGSITPYWLCRIIKNRAGFHALARSCIINKSKSKRQYEKSMQRICGRKQVKVLVLDADGVLTDSKIYISDQGEEMKAFNSKDGQGLKLIRQAGIKVAIITGRKSKALEHRCRELGIEHLIQNAEDKLIALTQLAEKLGCTTGEMAFMGDDVVDLPAMAECALTFAPADALDLVKTRVHYVTEQKGGRGAVREAIEIILRHNGMYDQVMQRYLA